LCFLLLFSACGKTEEPEPLPPIDFLVDLTLDLHLAEGPMARVKQEMKDSIGLIIRTKIAHKHGITEEYLEEIITRVQRDPILNVQVYDSVVVRLARMQQEKNIKK
jgi:hypothetical protein